MRQLSKLGDAATRKTHQRHGVPQEMFAVKIADLRPIAKTLKSQQELAMELYSTGDSDAMYLAGLVADGSKMT